MKKTILIYFVLLISCSISLHAQEKIRVIDAKTLYQIESASIKLGNKGAITNKEGYFKLKELGKITDADEIEISSIGYQTKTINLSEIKSNENVIKLEPKSELIGEIVISKKRLLGETLKLEEVSKMNNPLFAFGATLVDDKIYVIGGDATIQNRYNEKYEYEHNSGKMQIYDIKNDTWAVSEKKFSNRAYHNIHHHDGKIYVLGGKYLARNPRLEYLNKNVEIYDIKNDTIYSSPTNPHEAVNFTSGIYEDNIIVMGGSTKKYEKRHKYTNKAHLFNLKTGYWFELEDTPFRYETSGVMVDSILYQIGGIREQRQQYLNAYNVKTGEYKTITELPLQLERPAVAYNPKDRTIYIYGISQAGVMLSFDIDTEETYAYNIDADLFYPQIVCSNEYLYLIGGQSTTILEGDNIALRQYPSDRVYRIELQEFKRNKRFLVNKEI